MSRDNSSYQEKLDEKLTQLDRSDQESNENGNISLNDILEAISNAELGKDTDNETNRIAEMIAQFYYSGTRHSYAEIFIFLSKLQSNDRNTLDKLLEIIDNNLAILKDYITSNLSSLDLKYSTLDNNEIDLCTKFFKLRDHILLETARIKFWSINHNSLENDINKLNNRVKKSQRKAEEIDKVTNEALDEVKTFRTTQVTILTAFIAILLMVVTDIKFTASMVDAIGEVPLYQIALLTAFGAFVTLNLSFALLAFIANIIDKNIMVYCASFIGKTEDIYNSKKHCEHCTKSCWIIKRFWKRYTYMFIINLVLVSIMVGIILNSIYKFIMLS